LHTTDRKQEEGMLGHRNRLQQRTQQHRLQEAWPLRRRGRGANPISLPVSHSTSICGPIDR
jgi:hypothetical protein